MQQEQPSSIDLARHGRRFGSREPGGVFALSLSCSSLQAAPMSVGELCPVFTGLYPTRPAHTAACRYRALCHVLGNACRLVYRRVYAVSR